MSRQHYYCHYCRKEGQAVTSALREPRRTSMGPHLFGRCRMSKAKEIMHRGAECVAASDTLETAARMMRYNHVGALPIFRPDNRLQGIITDRDIVVTSLAERRHPKTTTAGDLAQGKPV